MTLAAVQQSLYDTELLKRVIIALACLAAAFLLAYGYFVATTIVNMVEYRTATERIVRVSAELGGLESGYIELGQLMTMEHAHELGFVDVPNPQFVALQAPYRLTLAVGVQ